MQGLVCKDYRAAYYAEWYAKNGKRVQESRKVRKEARAQQWHSIRQVRGGIMQHSTFKGLPGTFLVRAYTDITGRRNVKLGLMLSQIVFWYQRNHKGQFKLRVDKRGSYWLVRSSKEWEEEIGLSKHEVSTCLEILTKLGIIETEVMRFDCIPTVHLRLLMAEGEPVLNYVPTNEQLLKHGQKTGNSKVEQPEITLSKKGKSLTEITSENTTEAPCGEFFTSQTKSEEQHQPQQQNQPQPTLQCLKPKETLSDFPDFNYQENDPSWEPYEGQSTACPPKAWTPHKMIITWET